MIKFLNKGRKLDELDIEKIKRQFSFATPLDYLSFLENINGGYPDPNVTHVQDFPECGTEVQVLFGVGRESELENITRNSKTLSEWMTEGSSDYIPIGVDSGGSFILMDAESRVLFYDMDVRFPRKIYVIAKNFSDFIDGLHEFEE